MNTPFPRVLGVLGALVLSTASLFAQNLVVNGNFETGSLLPWVQSGNTSNSGISPNAQNPITANAMNQLGYQSGPITTGFLTQMIPTIPGALYDVGFWFALQATSAANEFRATFNGVEIYHVTNINPGSATISTVNFTPIMANAAMTSLQFEFRANGDSHWFLDDAFVTQRTSAVPENVAGFELLALGCVALRALKKKLTTT